MWRAGDSEGIDQLTIHTHTHTQQVKCCCTVPFSFERLGASAGLQYSNTAASAPASTRGEGAAFAPPLARAVDCPYRSSVAVLFLFLLSDWEPRPVFSTAIQQHRHWLLLARGQLLRLLSLAPSTAHHNIHVVRTAEHMPRRRRTTATTRTRTPPAGRGLVLSSCRPF